MAGRAEGLSFLGSAGDGCPLGVGCWDCPPSLLDTWYQVGKNRDHPLGPPKTGTNHYPKCEGGSKARKVAREALIKALVTCGRVSDADRVAACGEEFRVGKCLDCGVAPAFPITCDHRLCPDCASRRGAILVEEHTDILKQLRYPKMLTLTFVSVAHIDKAYIKWARECFTKLRHRKVMASCWGGIYSFETTHSDRGWHLHIHALIGSGYIDQGDLSREWKEITGAYVVDIRAVSPGGEKGGKWDAVKEVIKYPAKSATFLGSPELVNEFLLATEGVNLAYGFGAMYRVKTRGRGSRGMRCPVCGGFNIDFSNDYGFVVPKIAVEKVKGGYVWHPPWAVFSDPPLQCHQTLLLGPTGSLWAGH